MNIVKTSLAISLLMVAIVAPLHAQKLPYPETKKVSQTDTYFGTAIADPYRWLEDDNAIDTKSWVEAQNKVTTGYLEKIPYRETVKKRLLGLINYPRYGQPSLKAQWVFFSKNTGLQNQSVLYYQKGFTGAPDVLLDPNSFSTDGTARLSGFAVSKNGKYAAYGISRNGSDWQSYSVIEIATKKKLDDDLQWVKFSGADWRGDEGFYYSRYPAPASGAELTAKNENQKVYFHKVGTPQSEDKLVYEDTSHPEYSVTVGITEDQKYEILYVTEPGKRGNALYFREASTTAPFKPIIDRIGDDSFGVVDNVGSKFLINTNQKAPNSKIVLFDPTQGDISKATSVIAEKPEPLDGIATAGGKIFATYLKDVTTRAYQYSYDGKLERTISLPGPGTASGLGGEPDAKEVFYTFSSYNYPPTIFRFDIISGKSTLFRSPEIKDYNPAAYEVKQVFYQSKDGTKVPMFITYKKGLKRDGNNPTLLYGYGGFNINLTPSFSATRVAWLEQGGVYAVANLRGGAEYGEKWHEAGMRFRKQSVFDDCIAAAEYLIKEKYASPAKLALQGGSNGGLLVGAVINQRPELFAAANPQVGVMDMLRFQKFTAGKFWTAEYGSSEASVEDFKNLFAFSPLHNIKQGGRYPATLITTADHDDRVVPAHSFKYAATLQEKASKERPLLIRIETNSGHGSSNLTKAIEETADVYSFLFYNLGVTPK